MILQLLDIKNRLEGKGILHSKDEMYERPTVIGYEKKHKWQWLAMQMNTFVIASDFDDMLITKPIVWQFMHDSFAYTRRHHTGWPHGLHGLATVSVLISSAVHEDAIDYCRARSHKSRSTFLQNPYGLCIPVIINSSTNNVYFFEKNPIWGFVYYPYLRQLIEELIQPYTMR